METRRQYGPAFRQVGQEREYSDFWSLSWHMQAHTNLCPSIGVKKAVKKTRTVTPSTATRCLIFHRSAFSLLELLIVIAVIAILMSLLQPALSRSRVSARSVQCLNNLHQIGIATRLYLDEAKSSILPSRGEAARWPHHWIDLEPNNTNLHASRVWYCPAWKEKEADAVGTYQFNRYGSGLSSTDQQPLG